MKHFLYLYYLFDVVYAAILAWIYEQMYGDSIFDLVLTSPDRLFTTVIFLIIAVVLVVRTSTNIKHVKKIL